MKSNKQNIVNDKIFNSEKVDKLINDKNYSDALVILLRNQKLDWQLLEENYSSLQNIKTKTFQFEGFAVDAQFNPGRIKSTKADISKEGIEKRECFLCLENLPKEQKGINYKDEYLILCNPHPIFHEHFTIAFRKHFPQRINGSFQTLLNLSKSLSKYYSVLYNGPECGASAPDHLHFQAVNKNYLKILDESDSLLNKYGERIIVGRKKEAYGVNDGLRKFIVIKSKDENFTNKLFGIIYSLLQKRLNTEKEPMINILGNYDENSGWVVYIFLRMKHRPGCYFKKGAEKILISPAIIDFAGTLILPSEQDFDKITLDKIATIFNEVSIGKELFDYLKARLKKTYQNVNYF